MIFAPVLRHVCYKPATKWEYASVYRCMLVHTYTHSPNTHLPVQISPPAVHFSLALWSLFMSPRVPPSKPLFLLRSPSVPFHTFLPPFLVSACVFDFSSLSTDSVIKYFIMTLWTKWNVAFPPSCTFFFLCSCCITGVGFLPPVSCMQPRCNTKPLLQQGLFVTFLS